MGRKVEMKKIEDITKCQVTFSKRRSSLMKKAQEISVCCDVDVAFIAFSPSGRVSKFCSKRRIEDVLLRYVTLPADRRLNHVRTVQEKQEKLRQLDHIKGDSSKLHYLDKQIENLELQIKKSTLELQILDADLRDYEPGPEQEPSLHQLSWCERNMKQSLQRVMARKNALFGSCSSSYRQPSSQTNRVEIRNKGDLPVVLNNLDGKELVNSSTQNPYAGQLLMQLDPWISPYSARVRHSIFEQLLDQGKGKSINNQAPETSLHQSGTCSKIQETQIPPPYIPMQQPLVGNQSPPSFQNEQPGAIGRLPMAMNIGFNAPFGVKKQHLPNTVGQQGMNIGQSAPIGVQHHQLPHPLGHNGAMFGQNETLGLQQHLPCAFGHHMENLNGQDGTTLVNQLISNQEQQNLFCGGSYNSSQSLSVFQTPIPERITSPRVNAPFLNTSTSTVTTTIRVGNELGMDESEPHRLRFGLETWQQKVTWWECLEPNSSYSSLMNLEPVFQPDMDYNDNNSYNNNNHDKDNNQNNTNNNDNYDDGGHGNENHSPAVYQPDPPMDARKDSLFGNLPIEDGLGDNTFWTTGIQDSAVWEWDDLVLANNFNLENIGNFPK